MPDTRLTETPVTDTGMLIRKPAAAVFQAFVDPKITSKFWFTKGSGKLEPGKLVEWTWEMYDFSIPVKATVVEPHHRLVIEWPGYLGLTKVEWKFAPQP